ncbi:MAG TPA: acyl-CoA dehydratase activase, partial [Candidatus Hypogeohydataceae bacterium YC41]
MLSLGIDIGSLSTDVVLMNEKREIVASEVIATGASSKKAADKAFQKVLEVTRLSEKDIDYVVATGYGRIRVPFAQEVVTEITCHAKGAHYFFAKVRTVIDIGGQDSKVIKVDQNGNVVDFVMNDKCAAGTGRFLEVMARTLEIELEDMGPLSLQGSDKFSISSLCTVFAESEVVSLIGADQKREDICRALHIAIAKRIAAQARRVGVEEQVVMSGGVAKNVGVVKEMERLLSTKLRMAPDPQIVGAVGAALIGLEGASKKTSPAVYVGAGLKPATVEEKTKEEIKVDASLEESSLPKMGYLCTYTPIEVIRAAGFHPVRVTGAKKAEGLAEEHLCTNICPYIKAAMEEKLSGSLEGLEGIVFMNSCDGMRRLYDAWKRLDGDKKFNYILDLPKTTDPAAVYYFSFLIKNFKEMLEKYYNRKITHEELHRSILLYNRVREKVRLFLQKQWNEYSHSGYEIFLLMKRGINAVPEKFHDYITHLMKDAKAPQKEARPLPRLLIWGGILENEEIIKTIEEAGARVVADDLCSGSRFYDTLVEVQDDPFTALAGRYLRKSPCSRMVNVYERIHRIFSIIEERSIHGAIYHTLKFCDHSLYDYPTFKKEFEKKKIPLLHLTCDYSPSAHGQIRTRVEAF